MTSREEIQELLYKMIQEDNDFAERISKNEMKTHEILGDFLIKKNHQYQKLINLNAQCVVR